MKKGLLCLLAISSLGAGAAMAEAPKDVFKGKLFAPNIILEHRDALQLSKDQFTAIRAAVVEVQAGVAEYEWDMQDAYRALMLELDKSPIDEEKVLQHASTALLAENQVKKMQMTMLVRLKNLLTADQVSHLESVYRSQ
jgi:hypothetical protein